VIPVSEPVVGDEEVANVVDCLRTGWISSAGSYIQRFEEGVADAAGRAHGVAVDNGTNALITALAALDLPPGSEVLVPSLTIMSCARACMVNGLVPRFVDVDPETWTMTPESVAEHVGPDTSALMLVHLYGHPADIEPLLEIASVHDLRVVEDFAEAIGSRYRDRPCGSFGDISCTSFYANKTLTTGEGGMCVADDPILADRLRSLRNLCFGRDRRFMHEGLGFNFRMTNLCAAIGVGQLERLQTNITIRRSIAAAYRSGLAPLEDEGLLHLPVERPWAFNTYWMFSVVLSERIAASVPEFQQALRDRGVDSRPFFHPLHRQRVFEDQPWWRDQSLPVAEVLGERGLYLPSGLGLRDDEVRHVCTAVREVCREFRR
jgi:perosamine synthetase